MPTFGKTTDGATFSTSSATRVWVSQATPAESGIVQTGSAQFQLAGTKNVRMAIYADSAGAAGALLAQSDILNVTDTTLSWKTFTFSGVNAISVVLSTPYWIGPAWETGASNNMYRDGTIPAGSGGRLEQSFTWPTLPDPFGAPTANNTGPIAAYIAYVTPSGRTFRTHGQARHRAATI